MTTSNELDTVSHSWDEHSEHNGLPSQAQIQVAEASPAQKAAPATEPVPVDVGSGTPVKPEAPAEAKAPAAAAPHEYVADASNVVKLPANVSIDNIKVDGHNLVLEQADGSVIVIKDGALNVPTFIIGDVEVPRVALIAALEASHVDVAFGADGSISAGPGGSTSSAGGDFSVPPGGIGDGFGLSALLPPTDLAFGQPENRELFPSLLRPNSTPSIGDLTPEVGGGDTIVYEKGLTSAPDTSETNTGTFTISSPDGVGSLTIAGQVISGAALANSASTPVNITTPLGSTLTISGYDASTGQVSYSYTLVHGVAHPGAGTDSIFDNMTVTVTDTDGDISPPGTLSVQIVDDVPTAHNDGPYAVVEDGASIVSGNVLANDASGADTPMAFVAWSGGDAAAITALNTYGALTQNNDGTWSYVLDNSKAATQALTSASHLSYDLHYTMTDADGDTSPATLTITIAGTDDSATVVTAAAGQGADNTVFEAGLNPDGSNAAANSETSTGSFTISATDGIKEIVIGGTTFSMAQVQGFNGTQTVNTGEGVLTLTGYTGDAHSGTVAYSYTLTATIDNDSKLPAPGDSVDGSGFNDNVALTVNGVGGTTASDNLVVHVVDDVPTAHNDGPYAVVEDGASIVSGDVLANDASGADTPMAFVAWSGGDAAAITALNTYGLLTQNNDGTWSYVLDNSKAATQALTSGSHLSYDLHYTMTDADGDTSPATLTITIAGTDDSATVVTAAAGQGADNTVFEAGLNPDGSNAAANSETSTGSFTISATDGIKEIVIGGTTFSMAQVQGFNGTQTVNTGEGVLTLTGYTGDAHSGTVAYSYTLTATIDNDSKVPAPGDSVDGSGFNDNVALTVNGVGGTTASDNLVVHVVDDVPTAHNDGPYAVVEDGASIVSGDVLANDVSGADTPMAFVAWSGGDAATITALNTYGSLTQNSDGTWSYVLDNSKAATQALTSGSHLSYDLHYTMTDADGDTSPATLTITIAGTDDSATVTTAQAQGPDNTVFEAGLNPDGSNAAANSETDTGSFTISASDGIQNIVIGGTTFTMAQIQGFNGTQTVNTGEGVLTLTGYTGDAHSGTVAYSYTLTATIDNDSKVPAPGDSVDGSGFNDSVALTVNGVGGTTASDNLVVHVIDDVPTATADIGNVNEGALLTVTAAAGVLVNDVAGADGATIDGVRAAGGNTTTPVSGGVGTDIAGLHGTLHLNADGSYTYQSTANNIAANTTDVFVYTLKDGDGDLSTTTLTINLTDAGLVAPADNDVTVNEAALDTTTSGADLAHGTVIGSLPGSTAETDASNQLNATGNFTPLTYQLVSGGNAATAGIYGTIQVHTDGSYVYTLTSPVHGPATAGTDTVNAAESFTYQVTDANGNSTTGTINIAVIDDVPTATADIGNVNEGALLTVTARAGVLVNDVAGADGATIDGVRAAGGNTTTPVSGGVGTDIAGLHGTLHLNADGSYTYQSTANNIAANTTDVFVYTLKDGDGDLSTTTLTINLTDAGLVAPADNDVTVNEAALDTTTSGADLAHGTVIGSLPGSTAETDATNQLNATGNFTPLTYQLVSGGNAATAGIYGTIQVHTDGSYVYTLTSPVHGPATAGTDTVNAAESFTYQVTDANGNSTTGTINIAVIDDVPTATADIGNVNEGALLTVTARPACWSMTWPAPTAPPSTACAPPAATPRRPYRAVSAPTLPACTAHCISTPTAPTPTSRRPTTSPPTPPTCSSTRSRTVTAICRRRR
ncbi:hypothetical protein HB778_20040 [Mesorhizobium huakuii]|uniref:RapA2 cadherin-like domain-containing protein n=1 Tax=Mesorhizobium huakuii TaxID=28104 RepID=A0A7G6SVU4_9HYPH|nr:hypothetical protein HB778_20040 [Mesorhizobium huakuii]